MRAYRQSRRGFVVPMVALWIVVMFCFVALAVDIGLMALARSQAQNTADAAAIGGARALDGSTTAGDPNNFDGVDTSGRLAAGKNKILGSTVATSGGSNQVTLEVGSYNYVDAATGFTSGSYVPSTTANPSSATNWSAVRATVSTGNKKYIFAQFFTVVAGGGGSGDSFNISAVAEAVHRPRDIGISVDFSGSMGKDSDWGTNFHERGGYYRRSPTGYRWDPEVPLFGHYGSATGMVQSSGTDDDNLTKAVGPRASIMDDWWSHSAYDGSTGVSETAGTGSLVKAFTSVGAGVDSYKRASSNGGDLPPLTMATQAPSGANNTNDTLSFGSNHNYTTGGTVVAQSTNRGLTSGTTYYVGVVNGTTISLYDSAANATAGTSTGRINISGSGGIPSLSGLTNQFAKTLQEVVGTGGDTTTAGTKAPYDTFKGYTRGPNYWGATFFMWPPNVGGSAWTSRTAPSNDWRQRFFASVQYNDASFYTAGGRVRANNRLYEADGDWNPPAIGASGTTTSSYYIDYDAVMTWLLNIEGNDASTSPAGINTKILPDQLRNGRVMYYSAKPDPRNVTTGLSINHNIGNIYNFNPSAGVCFEDQTGSVSGLAPDGTTTKTLTTQDRLNLRFWKEYIDYVLMVRQTGATINSATNWVATRTYTDNTAAATASNSAGYQLMHGDAFSWGTTAIASNTNVTAWPNGTSFASDNPKRPKLQFWFGPLSMVDFCTNILYFGHWPGNFHQGDMWFAKAAVSGALTSMENSHPNDFVTMSYYSLCEADSYVTSDGTSTWTPGAPGRFNRIRAPLGRNYQLLKGALWYPVAAMKGSNTPSDWRNVSAYDTASTKECPYARGNTQFNIGLQLLYNQFSSNTTNALKTWSTDSSNAGGAPGNLAGAPVGEAGGMGRRGAQKVVIFETDGIGNTTASYDPADTNTFVNSSNSTGYYKIRPGAAGTARNELPNKVGDGWNVEAGITAVAQQLINTEANGGFTLTNKPCVIHCIMFGRNDAGNQFSTADRWYLRKMEAMSGILPYTGALTTANVPDLAAYKQIDSTDYNVRKTSLETAIGNIMNDGITLSLIK